MGVAEPLWDRAQPTASSTARAPLLRSATGGRSGSAVRWGSTCCGGTACWGAAAPSARPSFCRTGSSSSTVSPARSWSAPPTPLPATPTPRAPNTAKGRQQRRGTPPPHRPHLLPAPHPRPPPPPTTSRLRWRRRRRPFWGSSVGPLRNCPPTPRPRAALSSASSSAPVPKLCGR